MVKKKEKVLLGVSGGFDSSLAIYLLQQKAYEVVGAFLQTSDALEEGLWERVQKIAEHFNIQVYKIDIRKKFEQKVIKPFLKNYQKGITPSPCVNCNPEIKFKTLADFADKEKIKWIATGHYIRKRKYKGRNYLYRGVDLSKDQTYFLYKISPEIIDRLIFPLGNMVKKDAVKKLEKVLPKKLLASGESQELCFIPNNDFVQFFGAKNIKINKGKIVNIKNNEVLGEHKGIMFYTIGQRKNLGLPGGPWFVSKLDAKKNIVYIVHDNDKDDYLFTKEIFLENIHWQVKAPKLPDTFLCKIRSAQKLSKVKVSRSKGGYKLKFSQPQLAVTPGQSIVFYKGERLLGGSELG